MEPVEQAERAEQAEQVELAELAEPNDMQRIQRALVDMMAEPNNQENIQNLQGVLTQIFGQQGFMQAHDILYHAVEEQREQREHREPRETCVWTHIHNDRAAWLRALHGLYMRFDIDSDYMRNHGIDYSKLSIERFTLPEVCDGDCLNISFGKSKILRVSASFIKYHSRTIADMLSNPLTKNGETGHGEQGERLEFKIIRRSVFKLILYMLYNPSVVSRTPYYFIRVRKLSEILSAVDMLDMKEVKHILEAGLIAGVSTHEDLEKQYSRIVDYGNAVVFARIGPDPIKCSCLHACGGIECAKIENPVLSVIDSEPGSNALVTLQGLLIMADHNGMNMLADKIIDVILSNKKSHNSPNASNPMWWTYKLSSNTCSLIIKKLLARPAYHPLSLTHPIYDE